MCYAAVGVEVGDAAAVNKEVVVGLEAESDALAREVEGDIKRGHGGDAVVGGQDVGILCQRNMAQRGAGARRRCC